VISPALAFEYEAVLKRFVPEIGLALQDVDDFVEYLWQPFPLGANLFQLEARIAGPGR
jgi:hypothetical protein